MRPEVLLSALKGFNSKLAYLFYRDLYPWIQKHRKNMKAEGYTEEDPIYRIVLMAENRIYEKAARHSDFQE